MQQPEREEAQRKINVQIEQERRRKLTTFREALSGTGWSQKEIDAATRMYEMMLRGER